MCVPPVPVPLPLCVGNRYRECGKALGSMWSVNVFVMFVGGEESRWQETGICIKGQVMYFLMRA